MRVNATARATGYGVSLWEFQVYGSIAGAGGCGTANAALGRPATASSTAERRRSRPASAVDGSTGTRWSSAATDPQWLQVDLGSHPVDLRRHAALGGRLRAGVPGPGLDRRHRPGPSVYSTTTGTGGTQVLTVSGTGRYVRVYGTARATAYGYSLWEFQVRTGSGPTTPAAAPTHHPPTPAAAPTRRPAATARLLSYNKPAVASTSQNDGNCFECTPAKAFDNDPASRWATSSTTGWVDPGWIYVDLGATAGITQVVLQWDPAFAPRLPDPGVTERRPPGRPSTPPRPAPASRRPSTPPAPAATCGCTAPRRSSAVRLLALGVQGVRHRRQPDHAAGAAGRTRRSPPTVWCGATSSTAPPAASRTRRSGRSTRAPARTTRSSTTRTTTTPTWTAPGRWSSRPAGRPPVAGDYTSHRMNTGNKFTRPVRPDRGPDQGAQGQRPLAGVLDDGRRLPHRPPVALQRRDRHHGGPRPQHRWRATRPCTRRPTTAVAATGRSTPRPAASTWPTTTTSGPPSGTARA